MNAANRSIQLAVVIFIAGCGAQAAAPPVVDPSPSASQLAAYAAAEPLLQQHCLICHGDKPVMPGYRVAPAGVVLETPEQFARFAPRVVAVVELRQMPPLDMTSMSAQDRADLVAIIRAEQATDPQDRR